ncbi:MAG: GNAT family N-acetyltransferase [Sporolactobacillus sp.]
MLYRGTHNDFPDVYALMRRSFYAEEIRRFCAAEQLLDYDNYRLMLQRTKDRRVQGFLAYWTFPDFSFIEHFAVAPEMRGRGIGTTMLRELTESAAEWLLEVEAYDNPNARRRIAFYERNGFILNAYGYNQPSLQPVSHSRPIPLQLMSYPHPWSANRLAASVHAIMQRCYRQ